VTGSPTFIATFADGEITRMTVFTRGDRLDLTRGMCLACAAYESRTKQAAPEITAARFEQDGEILQQYGTAGLKQERRDSHAD
jgi:hypothetical protein